MRFAQRMRLPALMLLAAAAPAASTDRISESCTGSETVQTGGGKASTLPYSLVFSADLARKLYCYGACGRDQSFAIADAGSDPIQLARLDAAGQVRHISYWRRIGRLTDDQVIGVGPIRVVRHATARCRPAPYLQPPG